MATTVSSSTAGITTQGIGSGLDIASIVDKLVAVESAPLDRLKARESAFQTRLSAYGAARGALASFQSAVSAISDPRAFASFTATINDDSVATVAIDSTRSQGLAPGTHTLRVDRLASAQRTASSAVVDTAAAVGTGRVTIELGTWSSGYASFAPSGGAGSKTVTIDATNNSLAGIRDAINTSGAGVTASIINDGTGNRLVVSGSATGAAQGFRITTADADGNDVDAGGLSQIAFDPTAAGGTPQSQHLSDAQNASFALDGLLVSKPDNHVTDAIDGLTFDLKKVDTATTAFTVARDTTTAKSSVNAFVASYNNIVSNLKSLTSYNSTTKKAGALNGDSSIRLIASRLQSLVATVLPGSGSVNTLADVGIKFTDGGTLTVDDAKLTSALSGNPDGVARLFSQTATSSDALVAFGGSTDKTQVGTHALTVTRLASRGSLTGSTPAGLTITAGVNDTLGILLDNVPATVTLAPGTYADAAALATQVQAQINGTSAFSTAKSSVVVTANGGVLTIGSQRYGSASTVALTDGNGLVGLFGAPVSTTGADVAGTIDGATFLGTGQIATGASGTAAEGLKLTISGGALGGRGSVDFSRGIAARLDDALTQYLDADDGLLSAATNSISSSIKDLDRQQADWTPRLVAIRARLTAQYNAMDALVASLNSTSSYLTQQLEALSQQNKANR